MIASIDPGGRVQGGMLGRSSWRGAAAFATIDDDDLHSVVIGKKT
jgi:hypothetical protein